MAVTGKPPYWWRTADLHMYNVGALVDNEIHKVKKLLQGRIRSEERVKFNEFTCKMHDQLALGKPKLAILSMMKNGRHQSAMDELILPDGSTTADATEIMARLTDHFRKWYQMLSENHGRGVYNLDSWEQGFHDWHHFYEEQRSSNVPKVLLRKIW